MEYYFFTALITVFPKNERCIIRDVLVSLYKSSYNRENIEVVLNTDAHTT